MLEKIMDAIPTSNIPDLSGHIQIVVLVTGRTTIICDRSKYIMIGFRRLQLTAQQVDGRTCSYHLPSPLKDVLFIRTQQQNTQ